MAVTATVAIVGRPNVGKSTLFNRLIGERRAIVHDLPGVTRDRITGHFELDEPEGAGEGAAPGRLRVQLVDTGGLVPGDDPLGLNQQVLMAVEESDLLLLVVDGKQGLVGADETVWQELRPTGKSALLVVNKGDTRAAREHFPDFYRLGLERQLLVSAEHATGVEELRETMAAMLVRELSRSAAGGTAAPPPPGVPAVAIVGRPNVGKSSIVNRLTGQERSLVSPQPGTTRDPVDTLIERDGRPYVLVDTAGIRRRSQVSGAPEELAVMMARRQIERAQVAVLVIDAAQGVTSGDLAIAGTIWELGRAAVVAVNKWDLLEGAESRNALEESWPRLEQILSKPARVNISALSGRAFDKLFPAVEQVLVRFELRLPTGEVNRIFEQALARRRPPAHKGRPWKLYYATQVASGPPTFMIFANRGLPRSDTYRRYLENHLRQSVDLPGVPVRLVIRQR